ncbi:MAG TPA: HEPN domain-containing protein [Gemmatimonadaceae bacterium]|nr:HEPN domain-containing protein [Gemmatimonadaceae bacterium]
MIQAASTADATLDAIVRIIADRFHPTRIILFGSRARGNAHEHSDYDLFVELESQERSTRDAIRGALGDLRHGVDVFISTPRRFAESSGDVGAIQYDIAREGVVVYAAPGVAAYPLVPPRVVREVPTSGYPSLRWWLRHAASDFRLMEREAALELIDPLIVTFHAHQSAEKLLKSALIAHGIHPPHTHVLAQLLAAWPRRERGRDDLLRACETLQEFYEGSRYPFEKDGYTPAREPIDANARACVLAARAIRDAVLSDPAIPRDAGARAQP